MWGQHGETLDTGVTALHKMTPESRQQQQFQRGHSHGLQSSPSVWITAAFPVKGASRRLSTSKWRNDTCLIHLHHVHELNEAVIKQTVKKRKLDEVILCLWTELRAFAALSILIPWISRSFKQFLKTLIRMQIWFGLHVWFGRAVNATRVSCHTGEISNTGRL